jgi:RNA polymerase sigma-70 factor (ECF subfamily)
LLTTRASLLVRIRDPRDTRAWEEFHELYAPLLYRYARARGLAHADAEDVRATCYENIVKQIGGFEYDNHRGTFKAWLKTLVNRRVVDLLRKRRERLADDGTLPEVPSPELEPDAAWDKAWRQQHLRYCVNLVRVDVPDVTFEAFELLMRDEPVAAVCERLGLNANQVYKAKSRILQLVRDQMRAIYADAA